MITKEWLLEEIRKLTFELGEANIRMQKAKGHLSDAEKRYSESKESVKALAGCIQGLKDELEYMESRNA